MAGSKNDTLVGRNADFSQTSGPNTQSGEANGLVTDGDLWIGSTALNAGGTHINVGNITSPDASVIVGYVSPNITLTAVGVSPTTFDADVGTATPALNVIQLLGGTNGIDTTAAGNTVTFNFDITEQPTIPTSFTTPSGVAVPALNNLNFANGTGVTITGAGDTVTINAAAATPLSFPTDAGTAIPAANALSIVGSGSTTTTGVGATVTVQLQGLTNHNVLVGAGTTTITKVPPSATSGVPLISQGVAADPVFGTAVVAGGGTGATTLTNHGVLIGQGTAPVVATAAGTAGQVLQSGGAGADPTYSTAIYPSTTTINQILYSNAANNITGLATANSATLVTTSTGVPVFSSTMTNGQLIIGSTGATPVANTLTAGTGISITNGAGTITIAVNGATVGQTITGDTGGALSPTAGNWNILGGQGVTTSGTGSTLTINAPAFTDTTAATLVTDNGYFATAAGTYTLPASPAQGELVIIYADTVGAVSLTANTGQIIRVGNQVSSTAGSMTSNARGDSLTLRFRATGSVWCALSVVGTWTPA